MYIIDGFDNVIIRIAKFFILIVIFILFKCDIFYLLSDIKQVFSVLVVHT